MRGPSGTPSGAQRCPDPTFGGNPSCATRCAQVPRASHCSRSFRQTREPLSQAGAESSALKHCVPALCRSSVAVSCGAGAQRSGTGCQQSSRPAVVARHREFVAGARKGEPGMRDKSQNCVRSPRRFRKNWRNRHTGNSWRARLTSLMLETCVEGVPGGLHTVFCPGRASGGELRAAEETERRSCRRGGSESGGAKSR